MKSSSAKFQRLINTIIAGIEHCEAYIDDAIIYNNEWNHHLETIEAFYDKLSEAKLTINLAKSEFCHATLTFLGLVVGQGKVKPIEAKVEAISDFPVLTCKRQLMRFLGKAGYYRKFCNNFSVIAEPLTNSLSKRMRFKWTSDCQHAFDKLKAILRSEPVLLAPNINEEFKLAVDASDVGAGGVLLQEDDNGVDHPVCYQRSIVNTHSIDITAKFAVSIKEKQDRLPTLYWLPKLHKRPYKARFIANSSSCTTTVLSKLLTSCLTAVKKHWIRYYDTVYERDGIKLFLVN